MKDERRPARNAAAHITAANVSDGRRRHLPPAAVIYARAAAVRRLAEGYEPASRRRRFGVEIADRIEQWADLRMAA